MKTVRGCVVALALIAAGSLAVAPSAAGGDAPGEAQRTWRPKERWIGVNLPYCFFHLEVRKHKTYVEEDFRLAKELGFNFIRLPLDYRCWIVEGDWNRIDEAALAPLDQALSWGGKYGLHVQFCFHRAPGYSVNRWPAEKRDLFREPEAQAVCSNHWAYFARRWKGVPNERLSFNLFNEPSGATNLAAVEKMLIAAIHAEDPDRFIVADGANYGREPVPELEDERGLVGQATRGYTPMAISHCGATWIGDVARTFRPRWPVYGFTSPLYGSGKQEWRRPLRVRNAPAGTWTVELGRVSGDNRFTVTADGATLADWWLRPKTNDPQWVDAEYSPRWKIVAGRPAQPFAFTLARPVKEVAFDIPRGDWVEVQEVRIASAGRSVTLPSDFVWGKVANVEPFEFKGWDEPLPFLSKGAPLSGEAWLERRVFDVWKDCAARGNFVMVGECGATNGASYDIYIRWMEDQLRVWKKCGFGFAMWSLRGSFGILDTGRKGAVEVDFHGHRLDKGLFDLINRYR